jgi:hypothetical protein
MSYLNENNMKEPIDVTFTINGMPLQVFKKFKNYAKDYRDNYSITIQVLMEKVDTLEYLLNNNQDLKINEIEGDDII